MAIITVRGPILPHEAGCTLSHEHLLCDLWSITRNYDSILDDETLAIEELAEYRKAGGSCLIDATSCGLGRNPCALKRISEATGVHIVMGAAWYRESVYPPAVYEHDSTALAELIIKDLLQGADETGIRAGIIGEIGTERHHVTPAQERVFRAAARAHRRTGACIMTHTTHFGELAMEQISLLREEGVSPDRVVISHLGDRHDTRELLKVAAEGVFLSIDNIGYVGHGYPADAIRSRNVGLLIAEGHLSQIVLGGDICQKSHLRAYGGKGYAHVFQRFLPLLKSHGVSEEAIHRMMIENPVRMLDIPQEDTSAAETYEESAQAELR